MASGVSLFPILLEKIQILMPVFPNLSNRGFGKILLGYFFLLFHHPIFNSQFFYDSCSYFVMRSTEQRRIYAGTDHVLYQLQSN